MVIKLISILKEHLPFGRNTIIAGFLTFLIIGFNYNKLFIPQVAFKSIIILLSIYGIASYLGMLLVTINSWAKLNNNGRIKRIIKVLILAIVIVIQLSIVIKVIKVA